MATGLPVIYQRGSGHDDLVNPGGAGVGDGGGAGLGFDGKEEIPALLEQITGQGEAVYQEFVDRIRVDSRKQLAKRYAEAVRSCL